MSTASFSGRSKRSALQYFELKDYFPMSNKNKNDQPEMIQMKDFSIKDVDPPQVTNDSGKDSQIKSANLKESQPLLKNAESMSSTKAIKQTNNNSKNSEKPLPVQKDLPPANLYKPDQPVTVRMKGMTIPVQGKGNQQSRARQPPVGHLGGPAQRTRVPEMIVNCKWCTLEQVVAANSHIFVCCTCNNMNQCKPTYNIFICCNCHCQVCYQLGVSPMIRCTRCRTINKVPISVTPNYQIPQNINPPYQKQDLSPRNKQREIPIAEQPPVSKVERDYPSKDEFSSDYPDLLEDYEWQEYQKKVEVPPDSPREKNPQS